MLGLYIMEHLLTNPRIVSMTYGRPTMTVHVPELPLPSVAEYENEDTAVQLPPGVPSKMGYYVEHIRQCRILGEILSNIYHSPTGGPNVGTPYYGADTQPRRLDAVIELDAKLSRYERAVNSWVSWISPAELDGLDPDRRLIIAGQRTVLHGR